MQLQRETYWKDVKRYFLTPEESGQLCLLSCLLGKNNQIFYPIINNNLELISFSKIAENFILQYGYKPYHCNSEEQAKNKINELIKGGKWACYFFESDTTGEKYYEEFYEEIDLIDEKTFKNIGIVNNTQTSIKDFEFFLSKINKIKSSNKWCKEELVDLFKMMLPEFIHEEKNKNLDQKM